MSLRIKELLKEKGYTIQSLSEEMGINRVSLTNSINGNPTLETLEKIAATINVHISDLFANTDNSIINCPHCGGKIRIEKEGE